MTEDMAGQSTCTTYAGTSHNAYYKTVSMNYDLIAQEDKRGKLSDDVNDSSRYNYVCVLIVCQGFIQSGWGGVGWGKLSPNRPPPDPPLIKV